MGWLFEAGVVAARTQILLALLILLLFLSTLDGDREGFSVLLETEGSAVPALLKWSFLATAATAAAHANANVSRTSARIEQISGDISRGRGRRVRIVLAVHLSIATAAMAVLTIASPPSVWTRILGTVIPSWLAGLLWTATISVGVAYFGANMQAAGRSLRR